MGKRPTFITDIDFSVRVQNALAGARIKRVDELCRLTPKDIRGIRNLGKTSVREIEHQLASYGLMLGVPLGEKVRNMDDALDSIIASLRMRIDLLEKEVKRCVELKATLKAVAE